MKNNAPVNIPVEKLHSFAGHPFKALYNEEMNHLIESVQELGMCNLLKKKSEVGSYQNLPRIFFSIICLAVPNDKASSASYITSLSGVCNSIVSFCGSRRS